MKVCLSFLTVLFLSCTAIKAKVPPQTPIVYTHNAKTLQANKSKISAKDPSLTAAYKQLLKDADKALNEGPFSVMEKKNNPPSGDKHDYMSLAPYFWPDPSKPDGLPYIRKDGQTNPEVKEYKDKEYIPKLGENVHTLALAYYFSGDEKYAEHAAKLLKVWFLNPDTKMNPNLNYGQAIKGVNEGRGAGLIDTRHLIKVIDGIGLLNGSKNWKQTDQKGMQQWFSHFLNWMHTSKNGLDELETKNNHGTWYDAQRLTMALFIDSLDLAKKIVNSATVRLDQQMDNEGKFPKEMERTIALHYNVFNLEAFFLIANMAEKVGIDFWNQTTPSGKSLKKGFEFQYPFLTQKKEWTGQQIKPFPYDEGYPILMAGAAKYNCKDCIAFVKRTEGDKAERLRLLLLY